MPTENSSSCLSSCSNSDAYTRKIIDNQNVLTVEEKKLHSTDKRIILSSEFIGLFSGSKNPRRQRLGILLLTLRFLKAQTYLDFTSAADQLSCMYTQNLAFLNLAGGPSQLGAEGTISRRVSREKIAAFVKQKKHPVQLSLEEASPTSVGGGSQDSGSSFEDQLCYIGKSQLFADRVVRLASRQLKDSRIDEDILFMPNPDKYYFFLKRAVSFKQGILKAEVDLGLLNRRLVVFPPSKHMLTDDKRKKILSGVSLPPPLLEQSVSSILQGKILDRKNIHFSSGKALAGSDSLYLSTSYKRKKSVSADPSFLGGFSAEHSRILPAIKQTRTVSRLLANVPAKPLHRAIIRK